MIEKNTETHNIDTGLSNIMNTFEHEYFILININELSIKCVGWT